MAFLAAPLCNVPKTMSHRGKRLFSVQRSQPPFNMHESEWVNSLFSFHICRLFHRLMRADLEFSDITFHSMSNWKSVRSKQIAIFGWTNRLYGIIAIYKMWHLYRMLLMPCEYRQRFSCSETTSLNGKRSYTIATTLYSYTHTHDTMKFVSVAQVRTLRI